MHIELSNFQEFLRFLDEFRQLSFGGGLIPVNLDSFNCMSARCKTDAETNKIKDELSKVDTELAHIMRIGHDIFPIVKVCMKVTLPNRLSRRDADGIKDDIDEVRYETWVSANSNFPAGKTNEFSLVSELREKLDKAMEQQGIQVIFESERPREWLNESSKRNPNLN